MKRGCISMAESTDFKVEKFEEVSSLSLDIPVCSFSGKPAEYYIGLSGMDSSEEVRILGAISSEFVETAIVNVLGQGVDEIHWPVILDLKKEIYYHSYQAHARGLSAIMGWKELQG
ncbi:MAG: hypothetical protein HKM92_10995 [Arenibacter sp.]|nr:hypothetical protein [Arenibacter sp.]